MGPRFWTVTIGERDYTVVAGTREAGGEDRRRSRSAARAAVRPFAEPISGVAQGLGQGPHR